MQVAVVGLSLFVVLLVWGVIRLIRIRGELVKSQKEMAESYAVVVATDKMKEVFCGTLQMKYGFLWILWWNCLTACAGRRI